jgi:hypothetical protein
MMTNTSESFSPPQIVPKQTRAAPSPSLATASAPTPAQAPGYLFVGVDIAKDSFVSAQFGHDKIDGNVHSNVHSNAHTNAHTKPQSHDNNGAGISAFVRTLSSALAKSAPGGQCIVLMEATGGHRRL